MDTNISGVGVADVIYTQKAQFLHTDQPYLGVFAKTTLIKITSNLKSNDKL